MRKQCVPGLPPPPAIEGLGTRLVQCLLHIIDMASSTDMIMD